MSERERLSIRLPIEMKTELNDLAATRGVALQDLVQAAIVAWLANPVHQKEHNGDGEIREQLRRIEIMLQTFMRIMLTLTPPVSLEDVDDAADRGEQRWRQYLVVYQEDLEQARANEGTW